MGVGMSMFILLMANLHREPVYHMLRDNTFVKLSCKKNIK
jgi:hypothetical protein